MSEIRKRILVVDDDPQILSGLAALLSAEWEVRTAETGKDALTAFAEFSPDVVLLDVQLPDFSGIELLHQFKMYSEAAAVIMMSGVGDLARVIDSMKLGAETFLQKPFDTETLTLTLQQVSKMIAQQRELLALRRTETKDVERLPGVSASI
ncbi:MAG TPA: response regulator, partial [Thermoanaerobaculia bacterium]|nr:response regulator [Thermoanaerobaculia bacterium]